MFIVGVAFLAMGYALAYHGIDVLAWSRSSVADHTRPVPFQFLLGFPLPTAPPNDKFYPPFRFTDVDAANAVSALGGAVGGINDPGVIPNSQLPNGPARTDPPGFNPNDPNTGVIPILPPSLGGPPPVAGGGVV